ncbi:putative MobA-related protein [Acetobacter nitrogenifigens DSM 23921 = NBRC 105050]|uniref:MobA-like NTP transferase domain-containing protein n=1 Tax=Acetobacter nitrogenifigens DSM 23921 = NBRC 105050 TaxID=1120919 RepID=A0A511X8I3_9PROT|nr:nucleotidyltransferase family protein [Acetobacter nitrogenifigens]GBQ91868.1 putative MobA-related protein [Acetobacter nitrogenifigens DSM 23921 = NBRC 105050]GEN59256.1 hypothetical protein ANI02nite_11400 [Acetobacter nitrogenifigens DSM 23921 = NBRC 105050]
MIAPEGRIVAAILAAGRSSRTGSQHKLLAQDALGRAMISRTVEQVVASNADAVRLFVATDGDSVVASALSGLRPHPAQFSIGTVPDAAEGMAASVRASVAFAHDQGAAGLLICLGDMPLVQSELMDALITAFRRSRADAIVPVHEGRRGNPTLWASSQFDTLSRLEGDTGGRAILDALAADSDSRRLFRIVGDASVLTDFDTSERLTTFARLT